MRNKPTFANIRSSASAGSGKTYSLTGRYIAIALEEADPALIVALTFTRKSAGEFLSEILKRTAAAAESEQEAKKLSKEVSGDENKYWKATFQTRFRPSKKIFVKRLCIFARQARKKSRQAEARDDRLFLRGDARRVRPGLRDFFGLGFNGFFLGKKGVVGRQGARF